MHIKKLYLYYSKNYINSYFKLTFDININITLLLQRCHDFWFNNSVY
jgi:hypothetical protein